MLLLFNECSISALTAPIYQSIAEVDNDHDRQQNEHNSYDTNNDDIRGRLEESRSKTGVVV